MKVDKEAHVEEHRPLVTNIQSACNSASILNLVNEFFNILHPFKNIIRIALYLIPASVYFNAVAAVVYVAGSHWLISKCIQS